MGKSTREKNKITRAHARQEVAKEYREQIQELTSENLKLKKMLAEYQEENRSLRSQVASLSRKTEVLNKSPILTQFGSYMNSMSPYMEEMLTTIENEFKDMTNDEK